MRWLSAIKLMCAVNRSGLSRHFVSVDARGLLRIHADRYSVGTFCIVLKSPTNPSITIAGRECVVLSNRRLLSCLICPMLTRWRQPCTWLQRLE